jgi:hypothetical protein
MHGYKKMVMNCKFVHLIACANYTGAASTGDHFSMKNYGHATILIATGAWAAGTAAVTLQQSTVVAGTDDKALGFTEQWNGSVLATSDLLTRTAVVANTFNLAAANTLYVIEIDAEDLDVDGGFDCVELNIATPGANDDFYGAYAILGHSRFMNEPPPTAITD